MSTTLEEKVSWMEAARGTNHGQSVLRDWLLADFQTLHLPQGIHIAGTNGKGSTLTWLELLLQIKGQSTGAFSSPHLISHNERLHLDGQPVSMKRWETIFDHLAPLFYRRSMTMFEMDLWMALDLFQKDRPDWILMETGLGGARDATTACVYPYGIITQIGLDHMALLGTTKEEIAQEKAGIIQPGMHVVTAETDPSCLRIFETVCREQHAFLHTVDRSFDFSKSWNSALPAYQKDNFLCALTLLQTAGFSFSQAECRQAACSFHWKARFEILRTDPLVLLDGAHNIDGIVSLCASLKASSLKIEQIYFSVLADKQADAMIEQLQTVCSSITLVFFDEKRLYDLEALALRHGLPACTFEQMMKALLLSQKPALLCGSLYFAGEILKEWPHACALQLPVDPEKAG